jgi:hypothetical protein
MKGLEMLLVLLGAGAVALALGRDRPLWALATAAVVSGGAAVAAPALFVARSVIFDPVAIGLVPFLVFVPGAAAGLLTKERARRAIRSRFAHFVPADLLPQIEADPDRALTPRGAERELTVVFIDMRGFFHGIRRNAARAGRDPGQRLSVRGQRRPDDPPRHDRQVHGRRDHGFLERPDRTARPGARHLHG